MIESVEPQDAQQQFTVRVTNSLQNACTSIELTPKYLVLSVMTFINTHIDLIRNYVQQHTRSNVKIQVYVCAQFRQVQDAQEKSKLHHSTSAKAGEEDLATFLNQKAQKIDNLLSEYNERSSGWILDKILQISFICSRFTHFVDY